MNLSWSHPFFHPFITTSAGETEFPDRLSTVKSLAMTIPLDITTAFVLFSENVCVFFVWGSEWNSPNLKKKNMDGLEILHDFSILILRTRCLCKFQMRRMESAIATVQRIEDKPKKMPGRRCIPKDNCSQRESVKEWTWYQQWQQFFPKKMHVFSSCKLKWQQKDPQTPSKIIKKLRIFYGPHHHHRELTW